MMPGDRRARERNQIEERDDETERDRIRHTHDQQHHRDRSAGDQADQDVSGDVAADGPGDVLADASPARLRLLRKEQVGPFDPAFPLEQHEERQEDDRHRRSDHGDHALRDGDRGARKPEHLLRAAVLDLFTHLLDHVVLALQEPESTASMRQVVHVVRGRLGEAVDLVDQLGHEGRADSRRRRSGPADTRSRSRARVPDGSGARSSRRVD